MSPDFDHWMSFFPLVSPPDALLADLENTGSPLARCPVLLTSDPPQNADPDAKEPTAARPPPPAYTPQQVDRSVRRGRDSFTCLHRTFTLSHFVGFCLSDSFCCNEILPKLQPRQTIQVIPSGYKVYKE